MYKILGSNQKVYGPVTAEQVRQWMTEGRVNAETLVQVEGSLEWKPLSSIPELAPKALPEPPPSRPSHPPTISVPVPPQKAIVAEGASSMAITGFVFGVLSLIPCCCLNTIFAIVGIVYSALALNRTNTHPNENKGLAIAGLVLSVIGLAGSFILPWFYAMLSHGRNFSFNWPHGW